MSHSKDDTVKYVWKQGNTVLGYGVTKDFERRVAEHVREEPGSVIRTKGKTSESTARKWGKERLKRYEKKYGALPPKNRPR